MRLCSNPQCSELHEGKGKCPTCAAKAEAQRRPDGNPYSTAGHLAFRRAVLDRDPICVLCDIRVSTVADHFPLERRDLVSVGLDPNDPARGRGLCAQCHNQHTAATSPGGWAARD